MQEKESLSSERDGLKSVAEELGDELQQAKAELGEQKTAVEYLNTQLEVEQDLNIHVHGIEQSLLILCTVYMYMC